MLRHCIRCRPLGDAALRGRYHRGGSKLVDGGIKWLETCGSTNDEARRLEAAGSIDTIVAFHQTKGRGRLARQWHSPLFIRSLSELGYATLSTA